MSEVGEGSLSLAELSVLVLVVEVNEPLIIALRVERHTVLDFLDQLRELLDVNQPVGIQVCGIPQIDEVISSSLRVLGEISVGGFGEVKSTILIIIKLIKDVLGTFLLGRVDDLSVNGQVQLLSVDYTVIVKIKEIEHLIELLLA